MNDQYIELKEYVVGFSHNPAKDAPDYDNCTRVYKSSPGGITLQIRGHQPLVSTATWNHKVRAQNLYAGVSLNKAQALELIAHLQQSVSELSE